MKWFVFWDSGSCYDGDHACGLESFDTAEDAVRFIETLDLPDDSLVMLIHGEELLRRKKGLK